MGALMRMATVMRRCCRWRRCSHLSLHPPKAWPIARERQCLAAFLITCCSRALLLQKGIHLFTNLDLIAQRNEASVQPLYAFSVFGLHLIRMRPIKASTNLCQGSCPCSQRCSTVSHGICRKDALSDESLQQGQVTGARRFDPLSQFWL